jgi:hypothetical protein
LLVIDVVDRRAIAHPNIIALTVLRRRVVNLKEELEQAPIGDAIRVERNLDRLRMRAVVAVGRLRHIAAGVANPRAGHAVELADQILYPQKHPPARIAFSVAAITWPVVLVAVPESLRTYGDTGPYESSSRTCGVRCWSLVYLPSREITTRRSSPDVPRAVVHDRQKHPGLRVVERDEDGGRVGGRRQGRAV